MVSRTCSRTEWSWICVDIVSVVAMLDAVNGQMKIATIIKQRGYADVIPQRILSGGGTVQSTNDLMHGEINVKSIRCMNVDRVQEA